jgi:hypothetical protein
MTLQCTVAVPPVPPRFFAGFPIAVQLPWFGVKLLSCSGCAGSTNNAACAKWRLFENATRYVGSHIELNVNVGDGPLHAKDEKTGLSPARGGRKHWRFASRSAT